MKNPLLKKLMMDVRKLKSLHPHKAEEIHEYLQLCIDEIQNGESVASEIEKCYSTIEEILEDLWVCSNCGSSDVEGKYWVNPNTIEIQDIVDDDNDYCKNCKKHTKTITQDQYET